MATTGYRIRTDSTDYTERREALKAGKEVLVAHPMRDSLRMRVVYLARYGHHFELIRNAD